MPARGLRTLAEVASRITGTISLADSSITPTKIIGSTDRAFFVSYSRMPATTVPMRAPARAVRTTVNGSTL